MDAGLAAFLGAIAGAAIAGIPPVVSAFVNRGTAVAQIQADKDERDAQREHEREITDQVDRRNQIREWRQGLARSHAAYQEWERATSGRTGPIPNHLIAPPMIDSAVWFQSLRTHLPPWNPREGASASDPAFYTQGSQIHCDSYAVETLGNEISRIQREWKL